MIDVAVIKVTAGNGGNGVVSFRREKYVARGGPDGGDGGDGGSVYLVGEGNLRTLDYFAGREKFGARKGGNGSKARKKGSDGDDLKLGVPKGSVVYQIDSFDDAVGDKKQLLALLRSIKGQSEVFHKGVDKLRLLGEVLGDGEEMLVVKGGKGGRGNDAFKSASNRTPREAERGSRGESKWLVLELKLLADVGLVGLPNAGKSTLLSVLTAARPKIADYEFTTLEPNLGVMRGGKTPRLSGSSHRSRRARAFGSEAQARRDDKLALKSLASSSSELVIADIPGLIEGASKGKGLGDEFLRHVERCQVLVHLVSPRSDQIDGLADQLWRDYQTIRGELKGYGGGLEEKDEIVVVNKVDLFAKDQVERIKNKILREFRKNGVKEVLFISAATGEGLEGLKGKLGSGV